MAPVPEIQIVNKQDYTKQHAVALPNAYPFPTLAPDSIRVQTSLLSLSVNNFSYARLGHVFGWWDFHPLPPSIPAEYSDETKFGRMNCWGYSTVLESNVAFIPVGTKSYGYWPIGNLPQDLLVEANPQVENQYFVMNPYRQPPKVMPIYNRYMTTPLSHKPTKESMGYDALMQVLFETGYLLNRFVYTWEGTLSHPRGTGEGWDLTDAKIDDAVVVLFAASGKTALSLAYLLRNGRPSEYQPRKVIGVTSRTSQTFVQETGLYDEVMLYEDSALTNLPERISMDKDTRVAFVDFGGRDNAPTKWSLALQPFCNYLRTVTLAGEVKHTSPEETSKGWEVAMKSGMNLANASDIRDKAIELQGERAYFEEFLREWDIFKEKGGIRGLKLIWTEGVESACKTWDNLAEGAVKGDIGPDKGFLITL